MKMDASTVTALRRRTMFFMQVGVVFITVISIFLQVPSAEAQAQTTAATGGGGAAGGGGGGAQGPTAAPTATGTVTPRPFDAYVGDICYNTTQCTNVVPNSECADAGDNSGNSRCRCAANYYPYSKEVPETKANTSCGLVKTGATTPACKQCETNEGTCVQDTSSPNGVYCQCPISRSGPNCEVIHVNVSCSITAMQICYSPHTEVNFNDGWRMYTSSYSNVPLCTGTMANATSTTCSSGSEQLTLSLNGTDLTTCGTTNNEDSHNRIYMNTIEIQRFDSSGREMTNTTPIVFNVYCSFTAYQDETFSGIGVGLVNGNDRGNQVNANLTFYVAYEFGDPIGAGVTLLVGDRVQFVIGMEQDQNYNSMQILRCTASSSPVIPDSGAETRVLMNNGCPVLGEVTSASWYWTLTQEGTWSYLSSGVLQIFKLSSSDYVFMHCALKLCVIGDNSCITPTPTMCTNVNGRKKRDDSNIVMITGRLQHRSRRAAATTTNVNVQTGMKVIDPQASAQQQPSSGNNAMAVGSPGFIALLVILGFIALILILVTIIVAIRTRRRKSVGGEYQPRPQLFALPRINRTHERF